MIALLVCLATHVVLGQASVPPQRLSDQTLATYGLVCEAKLSQNVMLRMMLVNRRTDGRPIALQTAVAYWTAALLDPNGKPLGAGADVTYTYHPLMWTLVWPHKGISLEMDLWRKPAGDNREPFDVRIEYSPTRSELAQMPSSWRSVKPVVLPKLSWTQRALFN